MEVKDLHSEICKTVLKEAEQDTSNGDIFHAHN